MHVQKYSVAQLDKTSYVTARKKKGKKGKGHPRTGHEVPEGEQMYSSTLPSTSALNGVGWSMPRPGCFTPRGRKCTHCTGG